MYINTVNRLATTQGHKLFLWLLETKQEGVTHKINHEKNHEKNSFDNRHSYLDHNSAFSLTKEVFA
jgi:hypothetical protein